MMRIYFYIIACSLCFPLTGNSQSHLWTLEECISYAMEHNPDMTVRDIAVESGKIDVSSARWKFAPSFSANASYSLSSGRVLDETTYSFTDNVTAGSSSLSMSGGIDIFRGFRKYHELKRANLWLRKVIADSEYARHSITVDVIACYFEILYAIESICEADRVISMLEVQEKNTIARLELGKVSYADLLQIRASIYDARNNVLKAHQAYELSILELRALIGLDSDEEFCVYVPENLSLPNLAFCTDTENIVSRHPEVCSAELDLEIAQRDLRIAKSFYYPSIGLSIGYGTSHSDVRMKALRNDDGTYRYEAYPFIKQYADNGGTFVSISLNIPIFSGMSLRNDIRRKRLAIREQECALRSVRNLVNYELMRMSLDAHSAWEQYSNSVEQAKNAETAIESITQKYEAGVLDVVTYMTVLSDWVTSKGELLSAKYEYIYKAMLLTLFYR